MSRGRFTVEQIIGLLREAEVRLSHAGTSVRPAGRWGSRSRPTIGGVNNTVA